VLARASFVASRGYVQRITRTVADLALPSAAMTHKHMLAGTSLLSILLLSFHLAQDALHAKPGTVAAGAGNLTAILILFVLLLGTVLLAERRSGQIIMLLCALFSIGMPVLHFTGGADLTKRSGALFFVWCLIALGVTGLLSVCLLVSELPRVWKQHRTRA
jgi:hypothetical protein